MKTGLIFCLTIHSAVYRVAGMTIDERIEKLAERHEALTQTVELLTVDLRELRGLVTDIAEGTARLLRGAELHEQRHPLDQEEVSYSKPSEISLEKGI